MLAIYAVLVRIALGLNLVRIAVKEFSPSLGFNASVIHA